MDASRYHGEVTINNKYTLQNVCDSENTYCIVNKTKNFQVRATHTSIQKSCEMKEQCIRSMYSILSTFLSSVCSNYLFFSYTCTGIYTKYMSESQYCKMKLHTPLQLQGQMT